MSQIESLLSGSGSAYLDRSEIGNIVVSGSDRICWLQGMVTNDLSALSPENNTRSAFMLDPTGHVLADLLIINREEDLLLCLDRSISESVYTRLEGFVVLENVEITEQSDFLACLTILGVNAKETVDGIGGVLAIAPNNSFGIPTTDVILANTDKEAAMNELRAKGLVPLSSLERETLRITRGSPKFGIDFDQSVLAPETSLIQSHISYTKGCYVGQEIVARIQSRGHTNRSIKRLIIESEFEPKSGTLLLATLDTAGTAKDYGKFTSSIYSPEHNAVVAFGMVRHAALEDDRSLYVMKPDGTRATVRLFNATSASS